MNLELTEWQKDIAIGTILAGSSLVKPPHGVNYYLSMRSKNDLWLNYKMQELQDYFPHCHLYKEGNTYRCTSICTPEFTKLHDLLYREKQRVVTEKALYPMKDIGLAIWYLDAGGRTGRNKKNVYMNTTKLGDMGTDFVIKYFKDLDIQCRKTLNKTRIRIIFSVPGTESFLKIIGHRVPSFVQQAI